jgi:excisionase family DNA binding protein
MTRRPLLAAPVAGFPAAFLAALLRTHGPEHLARLQAEIDAGRVHPAYAREVRQAWAAIEHAADEWRTWRVSVDGNAEPLPAETPAPSQVVSTREAAGMLRISERRVRQLLAEGRLAGEQRGREWQIDRASVALFNAGRGAA